jgi:LAO/AO transport system kinase
MSGGRYSFAGLNDFDAVKGHGGCGAYMSRLGKEITEGKIKAAAELIRKVEEESPDVYEDMHYLYPFTGKAYILGMTGLPGSGKSTIVNLLIKYFREQGKSVGVVAVDPSSPLTSGAILGDRVRMIEHSTDDKVFIKSLATRGWSGGLSRSAARIINILDAMGKDVIILETVGVGQTEVSIMNFAHTTVLVLVPEMGDYIQTIKAGVLEIGDIFVINKIDKTDPGELLQNMQSLISNRDYLSLGQPNQQMWQQKIILTSAMEQKGFEELLQEITSHRNYFLNFRREQYLWQRAAQELKDEVYSYFVDYFNKRFESEERFGKILEDITQKKADPYEEALKIMASLNIKKYTLRNK